MSKKVKIIIIVSVAVTLLVAAGVAIFYFIQNSAFEASESSVYVKKNGKIIEAGIEPFDTSIYSANELEQFINNEVKNYNASIGEERISVKEFEVLENVANMYLEYETDADYEAFHGETFFAGTLQEAIKEGYLTDVEVFTIYDGTTGKLVSASEITGEEIKVVVMEERMGIYVKGTITHISQNLEIVDENMAKPKEDIQDVEDYIIVIYK